MAKDGLRKKIKNKATASTLQPILGMANKPYRINMTELCDQHVSGRSVGVEITASQAGKKVFFFFWSCCLALSPVSKLCRLPSKCLPSTRTITALCCPHKIRLLRPSRALLCYGTSSVSVKCSRGFHLPDLDSQPRSQPANRMRGTLRRVDLVSGFCFSLTMSFTSRT